MLAILFTVALMLSYMLYRKKQNIKSMDIFLDGALNSLADYSTKTGSYESFVKMIDRWSKTLNYREYDTFMRNICNSNGVSYTVDDNNDGLISEESKSALARSLYYKFK